MKRYYDCTGDGDCEHCSYCIIKEDAQWGQRVFDCQGIRADKEPKLSSYTDYPYCFYKLHTLYELFAHNKHFTDEDKLRLVEDLCAKLRNSIGRKPFDCLKDTDVRNRRDNRARYRSASNRRCEYRKKAGALRAQVAALKKEAEMLEAEQQMLAAQVAIAKNNREELQKELDGKKE